MKQNNSGNRNSSPRDPRITLGTRVLGVLFVLYMLWQTVSDYLAGGDEAPSVAMLLLSIVVLGGGALFIGILGYREWQQAKEDEAGVPKVPDSPDEEETASEEPD